MGHPAGLSPPRTVLREPAVWAEPPAHATSPAPFRVASISAAVGYSREPQHGDTSSVQVYGATLLHFGHIGDQRPDTGYWLVLP